MPNDDHAPGHLALPPSQRRALLAEATLHYGTAPSPFGTVLLGWTPLGVCYLAFCDEAADDTAASAPGRTVVDARDELHTLWPAAAYQPDDAAAATQVSKLFADTAQAGQHALVLCGTDFQIKVWQTLIDTKPGERLSYRQLAQRIGHPQAVRAVGSALARNCIAYLIPCHRVVRSSGDSGRFRWGGARKRALLAWETAQAGHPDRHNQGGRDPTYPAFRLFQASTSTISPPNS